MGASYRKMTSLRRRYTVRFNPDGTRLKGRDHHRGKCRAKKLSHRTGLQFGAELTRIGFAAEDREGMWCISHERETRRFYYGVRSEIGGCSLSDHTVNTTCFFNILLLTSRCVQP